MKKLIAEKKARFRFKTMDILKSLICCTYIFPRERLRKSASRRIILNYKLGLEHIEKDLDIGNIIKKIRTLNYFMKMILDTDQRKLLKLRSSKLIQSDEDPATSIFSVKKCVDKDRMLKLFVDNLRSKKIDQRDIKLLHITGLSEIVDILRTREQYLMRLKGENRP